MASLRYVKFHGVTLAKVCDWFTSQGYTIDGDKATSRCGLRVWCFDGHMAVRVV